MELKFSKGKQLKFRKKKKAVPKVDIKESALQLQCDETLYWMKIAYLRFPDFCWKWLKYNAPIQIMKALSDSFGGMADNVCRIKVSEKYTLTMNLELKTVAGKLTGRQKDQKKKLGGVVSRSPDETVKSIKDFEAVSEKVKQFLRDLE